MLQVVEAVENVLVSPVASVFAWFCLLFKAKIVSWDSLLEAALKKYKIKTTQN